MLQPIPTQTKPHLLKAHAERCRHCGRALTHPGTVIPFVGVVGPECRHKFGSLLALVADVEMLQFDIDDQGSQRLASSICATLRQIGFEVQKNVNLNTRVLWLEIGSRRVTRRGDAMIKTWEQVRAEFETRLKLAAAERDEAAPYVPTEPVHRWGISRFRGQLKFLTGRGLIDEANALSAAYLNGGAA
ncbi:hypothetical protein GCM10022631_02050 [Deinococcus rubellus]|uniref:Uncharacterized protein n=1 Tax=Deinococcus rubellus TaxID=1889240 RepID=A0ABY5YI37_9DEIO|nr:hypothetical protein [Deinococcus rubellus]UWX64788.1 hypothetical protein N0D28_03755 [Deinococcus rubellus]